MKFLCLTLLSMLTLPGGAFISSSKPSFGTRLMKARGEGYGQLLNDISQTIGNTPGT